MRHNSNLYLLIIISILVIIGCSRPYLHPSVSPKNATFSGIESMLNVNDSVILISIHGMCYHDLSWFEQSRNRIAARIGMTFTPVVAVTETGPTDAKLFRSDLTNNSKLLRTYGIVYSDILLKEKQSALCRDVKKPTAVCPEAIISYGRQRASLNDDLKNILMNDCLADAVAYL